MISFPFFTPEILDEKQHVKFDDVNGKKNMMLRIRTFEDSSFGSDDIDVLLILLLATLSLIKSGNG